MDRKQNQSQTPKCIPVRHAEKRRTSTCKFADRVARISVEHYRKIIPEEDRPRQTCMATIVSHYKGNLRVQSMGVGTKFLLESVLVDEANSECYGRKVRDTHAEVLARRAFRRQLTLEILNDLQISSSDYVETDDDSILCRSINKDRIRYTLKTGVTIHMYTSSAPCGNATLKKFAKMTKEKFIENLSKDEWPVSKHEIVEGHSIRLGQFALLVKKDNSSTEGAKSSDSIDEEKEKTDTDSQRRKGKEWPANVSDDWAPPGTTTVGMNKGSIHTCSDKICRWNCLGIQGSLLASLMERPIYISSLTVGRKLTECICRRAVCCRIHNLPLPEVSLDEEEGTSYRVNHPSIMGTAVYMDESGVVETSNETTGQDVRFHSTSAWTWWQSIDEEKFIGAIDGAKTRHFECIDGFTGFLADDNTEDADTKASRVSTLSLLNLFLQVYSIANNDRVIGLKEDSMSLRQLLDMKKKLSPNHEAIKDQILSTHRILRQWKRRSQMVIQNPRNKRRS